MKRIHRIAMNGLLALAVAACGPSEEIRQQLAQLEVVSAEKDSLLSLAVENGRIMNEISAEIARVSQDVNDLVLTGEGPAGWSAIHERVSAITDRLIDTEQRLDRSQSRVRGLSVVSDSLRRQMTSYEEMLTQFRETIDTQRATLTSLTEQVQALENDNTRLTLANATLGESVEQLQDSVTRAEAVASRAYYIIGTEDELKERGIIQEKGGSRFPLIFAKTGTTLVPSDDLDPSLFTEIDIRNTAQIELPQPEEEYRIVSTQNLAGLDAEVDDDRKVSGALRIASPQEFWSTSRFLILVES